MRCASSSNFFEKASLVYAWPRFCQSLILINSGGNSWGVEIYRQFINNALGNWDQLDICQVYLAELNLPEAALATLRNPTLSTCSHFHLIGICYLRLKKASELERAPIGFPEGMRNGPEEVSVCV